MSNEKSFTEMIIASMGHCSQTLPQCNSVGYGHSQYIARNFRTIQIFMIFTTHDQNTKFSHAFCVLVSLALTIALYRYFNRLTMSYTLPKKALTKYNKCHQTTTVQKIACHIKGTHPLVDFGATVRKWKQPNDLNSINMVTLPY